MSGARCGWPYAVLEDGRPGGVDSGGTDHGMSVACFWRPQNRLLEALLVYAGINDD